MIRRMKLLGVPDRAWAILFARLILGLIFGMAGWGKIFKMGPTEHAHRFFVDPFASSWIPTWLLWALGLSIPFVEFASGWLVFAGLFTRPALIALGIVLAIVTYGHLLKDFLYEFHTHVIPRLALLLFLLVMPREEDVLSLEHLFSRNS
jgi:putative oxidoreductase